MGERDLDLGLSSIFLCFTTMRIESLDRKWSRHQTPAELKLQRPTLDLIIKVGPVLRKALSPSSFLQGIG